MTNVMLRFAAGGDLLVMASQSEFAPGRDLALNLTRVRPIRALLLSPLFPYVFQALALVGLALLALLGFATGAAPGVPDKLHAKATLVTLVVWGLWWPAMIWAAVILGRVWCMICPLELVSNVGERIGRLLGLNRRTLGRAARAGWIMLALFLVLQLLVPGLHLHRSPVGTGIMIAALVATAAIAGLLYRHRAFCRGFCPVGLLLSAYSRGGVVAMRPAVESSCAGCGRKDCTDARYRDRLDGRSCPTLLDPSRLRTNSDCLLCAQCVKVCGEGNMELRVRNWFTASDARPSHASWPVTLFVMVASGFVTSELAGESALTKDVYFFVPQALTALIGVEGAGGWIEGLWTLAVVPLVFWILMGFVSGQKTAVSLGDFWRRVALPMAVVVSTGHMVKALAKFVSWSGFLPIDLSDPVNRVTSAGLSGGTIAAPAALVSLPVVSAVGAILLVTSIWLATREARLAGNGEARHLAPALVIGAVYLAIAAVWVVE